MIVVIVNLLTSFFFVLKFIFFFVYQRFVQTFALAASIGFVTFDGPGYSFSGTVNYVFQVVPLVLLSLGLWKIIIYFA